MVGNAQGGGSVGMGMSTNESLRDMIVGSPILSMLAGENALEIAEGLVRKADLAGDTRWFAEERHFYRVGALDALDRAVGIIGRHVTDLERPVVHAAKSIARQPAPPVTVSDTMRVRILVRVGHTPGGDLTFTAAGWGTAKDGVNDPEGIRESVDAMADADGWTDGGRYTWVVADVPVPDVTTEVRGKVEP